MLILLRLLFVTKFVSNSALLNIRNLFDRLSVAQKALELLSKPTLTADDESELTRLLSSLGL